MPKQYNLYIDGQWTAGDAYVDNVSPSDANDVIGVYAQANPSQVEGALQAANRAVLEWGD